VVGESAKTVITNSSHGRSQFDPRRGAGTRRHDAARARHPQHFEGERAAVTGFLHRAEEGSAAESVNCAGSDGRDIHLNINEPQPNPPTFDEWTGVVVEVIPQAPLPGWTSADHVAVVSALQAVRDAALPVLAVGSPEESFAAVAHRDKRLALAGGWAARLPAPKCPGRFPPPAVTHNQQILTPL
jgi:hypothetical protein